VADNKLAEHKALKEFCEDVDPDYKRQLALRQQSRTNTPTKQFHGPPKAIQAPPKHVPKSYQALVNK